MPPGGLPSGIHSESVQIQCEGSLISSPTVLAAPKKRIWTALFKRFARRIAKQRRMSGTEEKRAQVLRLSAPAPGTDPLIGHGELVASLDHAYDRGARLIDVTNLVHLNYLGSVLRQKRDDFRFAYRFGKVSDMAGVRIDSRPFVVREACEALLKRLRLGWIDLFYQEEVDPDTPIERTMWELKSLVQEGKVRHVGLAVDDPELLKRACQIHPVACVCLEWSLWNPQGLHEIVRTAREMGMPILAQHPFGKGALGIENDSVEVEGDAKSEGNEISDAVKKVLTQQNDDLVNKVVKLTESPGKSIVDGTSSFSASQDCKFTTGLTRVLERHATTLYTTIQNHSTEAQSSHLKEIRRFCGNQNAVFLGQVLNAVVNQRKALLSKLEELGEGLTNLDSALVAFRRFLETQKGRMVAQVERIRTRQCKALLGRVEEVYEMDQAFRDAVSNVVHNQRLSLLRWVSKNKENTNWEVVGKLDRLRTKQSSVITARLLSIKERQNFRMLKKLETLLGGDSEVLHSVEGMLNVHKQELAYQVGKSEVFKKEIIANKIQKLTEQQSEDMLGKINAVVDENGGGLESMSESTDSWDLDSVEFNNAEPDLDGILNRVTSAVCYRVREIAEKKGCDVRQVAIAWICQQGEDVVPVVPVDDWHDLVVCVEGADMELSEEDMANLCTGVGFGGLELSM